VRVVHRPDELEPVPRAVAIGTFDGVHIGHRRVIETALAAGRRTTVVTFQPHPRTILGNRVELLSSVERRLELISDLGVDETLLLEFSLEVARLEPEEFAEAVLRRIATETVVAGDSFRFGRGARGNLALLAELGFDVRPVPLLSGSSSSAIRQLVRAGEVRDAARLLGRPPEVEGTVVLGDQRGGTLGFPTANLSVAADLLVPAFGIYAGAAAGHRAAVSIGTNPHYGGEERRVEAYLLDFGDDLYGRRLVVEVWERLRDEQVFASEQELVAAIADDVARTRAAVRPA
jgi:riboflavin kinase/FMN adenylyltransferase